MDMIRSHDPDATILHRAQLKAWVAAEFAMFRFFLGTDLLDMRDCFRWVGLAWFVSVDSTCFTVSQMGSTCGPGDAHLTTVPTL